MRAARDAHGDAREQLREPLADFLAVMQQHDLLDAPGALGAPARSASEDGRTKAPGRRRA
jgi:hypothetical protein